MTHVVQSPSAARMIIDGRPILNFGGSCYLGLSAQPELVEAGAAALRQNGSTGQLPRPYGFILSANRDAEVAACRYFDVEAALYFATGYLFGLITLPGLAAHYDVVVMDELGHFSLREGALIAGKPVHIFKHCDVDDFARILAEATTGGKRPLVATDGMFATFGTIAPLADYQRLLAGHDGWLVVDESHSFGVLGATGRGAVEQHGVAGPRTIAGGSLGKALCAYGGFALGSQMVIEALMKAPAARGAAGGMSAGAAMAAAALTFMRAHPERLVKLRDNVCTLKTMLAGLGLPVTHSDAPVSAFVLPTNEQMTELYDALWADGIYVIRSNYIGAGPHGAIRIAAFADHEPADFERLRAILKQFV
jgi:7-keto-8-aminopelargonate synthetase-like enzyme